MLPRGLRVLVTGGASGIGLAIAEILIAAGARVHVCDVSEALVASFKTNHPGAAASLCDVSSEDDVERLFCDIVSGLGGLDALVNNAGVAGPTAPVEQISIADWRRTIDVVLTSQFLCSRLAVGLLKESGGGCIVNISSCAGRLGYPLRTPYSAAKWGVIGFTQSLAKELGPSNIRVNAVLPGAIAGERMDTVITKRAEADGKTVTQVRQNYIDRISLRRLTETEDVASAVLFLLSRAGRNISGQSLGVDGNLESL